MKGIKFKNILLGLAIGVLIIALSFIIPTRYYVMCPGISQELSAIITVEDGVKGRSAGDFMLTAVFNDRASLWDFVYFSLARPEGYELIPMGEELPPGVDRDEYIEYLENLMEESKLQAQAVAFRQAGYEVEVDADGVEILETMEGGTAADYLYSGDIIVGVDGREVE